MNATNAGLTLSPLFHASCKLHSWMALNQQAWKSQVPQHNQFACHLLLMASKLPGSSCHPKKQKLAAG
jgi:hypothetical protein